MRAIYRIPAGEGCPAHARAAVDHELRARVPLRTLEQLELMVSELVTGAVPHAAEPEAAIVLDLRIDHQICCSVIMPGLAFGKSRSSPNVPRGWALRLVAGLSERWGISRAAGDATRVWFEASIPD